MTMPSLPADVHAYKRTPVFDQNTMPAGLRRQHETKAGVWGKIVVLEGSLSLRMNDDGSEHVLSPGDIGVVSPRQPHEAEPLGDVKFYIEFYSATPGTVAQVSPNGIL